MTAVEYIVSVKDNGASSTVDKIGKEFQSTKEKSDALKSSTISLKGILESFGIGLGFYKIGELLHSSIEKAHELHAAEAQLKNTMQDMGTYSAEAYEKVIAGSRKLSSGLNYSTGNIVSLQSQLRLVGNIGENEMQKLVTASADMSTKFGMGLTEAGNTIAKAVNNPEMMRRLGMQLKIDPSVVKSIQDLAKSGDEAGARLALIKVIEDKIGGSAKAAFDADPMSRYNKAMEELKLKLGESAIKIQVALAPALIWLTGIFNGIINVAKWLFHQLNAGNPILWAIIGAFVGYGVVMAAITLATSIWTGVQWLLNVALTANPVGLIIAAIVALIAIIAIIIYKTDGWGKTWKNTVAYCKLVWSGMVALLKYSWLSFEDVFLKGIEQIEKGWYKIKGLWDKDGANKGLAELAKQRNERAKEISQTEKSIEDIAKKAHNMKVWEVHWNDKKISDIVGDVKKKLGLKIPSEDDGTSDDKKNNKETTDEVASGGTRSTHIQITLKNLVESIHFQGGIKENSSDVTKQVTEALIRVLYAAESAV